MPKKRKAPTLVEQTLRSIGRYVFTFGKNLINSESEILKMDREMGMARLAPSLQSMKHYLSTNVPRDLYDEMAMESLKAIENLIYEFDSAINLVRVVLDANLRSMKFESWPEIMQIELFHNLHCMTGLEVLSLWSYSDLPVISNSEEIIIKGVSTMPNLVSFTLRSGCTDNIIVAVGQNCPKLRYLNVACSKAVTDRSVSVLLKNRQLRSFRLTGTSVTLDGYANLLSGLPHLENIEKDIGTVLDHIREKTNNSDNRYHLRYVASDNVSTNHLYLLTNTCPYITQLSLVCEDRTIDLSVLAALNNLKELDLKLCHFYANRLETLLELTNCRITDLDLTEVDEFDRSALVHIGQSCPDIITLTIAGPVKRFHHTTTNSCESSVKPFAQLESICWDADLRSWHLKYLLSHCVNLKSITLGGSNPLTGAIDDKIMKKIFTFNPMTKLEEFDISPFDRNAYLSMSTVRILMENCKNLRKLSNLENWSAISPMELQRFREQLRVNNIDLDTSPTWPY